MGEKGTCTHWHRYAITQHWYLGRGVAGSIFILVLVGGESASLHGVCTVSLLSQRSSGGAESGTSKR